ncbi:MAG: polyphenol oxidase family protein [Nitriliruptoraceae bacterium]
MPHIDVTLTDEASGCFSVDPDCGPQHPTVGARGNLAHHRPHHPEALHAARKVVGERSQTVPKNWHLMRQIHSANVGVIDANTSVGAQLRDVDALYTTLIGRTLGVFTADCLPVLIAGRFTIAAVHAGRAGIEQRILTNTITQIGRGGERLQDLRVVIGPAIGGCCYELPEKMVDTFCAHTPCARAQTSWGTAALDLTAAAVRELADAGVDNTDTVGICTACNPAWFSHRRDPKAGRAIALITRHEANR